MLIAKSKKYNPLLQLSKSHFCIYNYNKKK